MKKIMFYLIFYVFFCLLQFFFGQFLSVSGVFPNFILIAIIYLALSRSQTGAEIMGFIFGLTWDAFSTDIFGARAILFAVIGYCAGLLNKSLDKDQAVTQLLVVFAANMFYWIGFSLIYVIAPAGSGSYTPFEITLAGSLKIIITTLVAPFVFAILNFLTKKRSKRYM